MSGSRAVQPSWEDRTQCYLLRPEEDDDDD